MFFFQWFSEFFSVVLGFFPVNIHSLDGFLEERRVRRCPIRYVPVFACARPAVVLVNIQMSRSFVNTLK